MSRPRKAIPSYRFHPSSNRGRVIVADEVVYFPGQFNSAESLATYRRWLTHYLETEEVRQAEAVPVTIGRLILAFDEQFVGPRYRATGPRSGEAHSYKTALRALARLHADTATDAFTPRDLKDVRQALADEDYWNRHAIVHGLMQRAMGVKDSAKCLMAINFLFFARKNEETPVGSDETESDNIPDG